MEDTQETYSKTLLTQRSKPLRLRRLSLPKGQRGDGCRAKPRFGRLGRKSLAMAAPAFDISKLARMVLVQKNNIIDTALYNGEPISLANPKQREVLKVLLKKKPKFRAQRELLFIKKFLASFEIF